MTLTEMWVLFWAYVLGMVAIIFGVKYVFLLLFWMFLWACEFFAWFFPKVGM